MYRQPQRDEAVSKTVQTLGYGIVLLQNLSPLRETSASCCGRGDGSGSTASTVPVYSGRQAVVRRVGWPFPIKGGNSWRQHIPELQNLAPHQALFD